MGGGSQTNRSRETAGGGGGALPVCCVYACVLPSRPTRSAAGVGVPPPKPAGSADTAGGRKWEPGRSNQEFSLV